MPQDGKIAGKGGAATKRRPSTTTARFERAIAKNKPEHYFLRLYITGMTPRSTRAIENLKAICEEYLQGHYELEIVDIYQRPTLLRNSPVFGVHTGPGVGAAAAPVELMISER